MGGCEPLVPGSRGLGISDEQSSVDALEYWLSEVPALIGTMLAVVFLAFGVLVVVALIAGAPSRAIF